jgi:hypothetical protein
MGRAVVNKKDVLDAALRRQKWKCCWCGCQLKRAGSSKFMEPNDATREHMMPKLFGGTHCKGNIRAACFKCNVERGAKMEASLKRET